MKILCVLICAATICLAGCTQLPPSLSILTDYESAACVRFIAICNETITSYKWSFGDGETSTEAEPSHVYDKRGEYTVNITVGYEDGSFKSTYERIEVGHDWHVYGDLHSVIEDAEEGDTIYVHRLNENGSGNYSYDYVTVTKQLELISPDGCELSIVRYENTGGLLSGFVISRESPIFVPGIEPSALTLIKANVVIVNCTFDNNEIGNYYGAGVYAADSPARFERCTFTNNDAGYGGGAVAAFGSYAFPSFYNCTFSGNTSDNGGGAILVRVLIDGALLPSAVFPIIEQCVFTGNASTGYQEENATGGAIHVGTGCSIVLRNNTFTSNSPTDVCYEDI